MFDCRLKVTQAVPQKHIFTLLALFTYHLNTEQGFFTNTLTINPITTQLTLFNFLNKF